MGSMNFCPKCGTLMMPRRSGGTIRNFCPRCGGFEENLKAKTTVASGLKDNKMKEMFPLFPYSEIRPGQVDFMKDIKRAVEERGILFAQAPTGIGKTAATLSVMVEAAIREGKTLFFLTSKQSQHHIAVETLKAINKVSPRPVKVVDIISKQDMCPEVTRGLPGYVFMEFCKARVKAHKCEYYNTPEGNARVAILSRIMHVDDLVKTAVSMNVCPHKAALSAATEADVVICDYNYIFSDLSDRILDRMGRELEDTMLIVDEAHNLPDRIRGHLNHDFSSFKLEEAAREVRPHDSRTYRYTVTLMETLARWADSMDVGAEAFMNRSTLIEAMESIFSETLKSRATVDDYIQSLTDIGDGLLNEGAERSYALELADFLQKWIFASKGVTRIFSRPESTLWTLSIRFMDPALIAAPILQSVHSAVLMSGTLYPPEMYADILGAGQRAAKGVYRSPFPVENRKTLVLKGVTTQYKMRGPEMWRKMADYIGLIHRNAGGNVAVFFPSYSILDQVSYTLADRHPEIKLIVEERAMTKKEKVEVLDRLKRYRDRGAVLMGVQGGSLSEGIDYRDNLLSVVCVVGLPLAPPNLETKAVRAYYTSMFNSQKGELYGYIYPAINKVVQSLGRLIRSETDRGVVVLMEERFLLPRYSRVLPPELKPKTVGNPRELANEIALFFNRKPVLS